jgi:NADH-quinone oxidoreductase subunit L
VLFDANLAWLIPAICFTSFVVIFVSGKFLPGKSSFLSIFGICIAFLAYWVIFFDFLSNDLATINFEIVWISIGIWEINWGFLVDRISIVMLGLVTFISLVVQIYSVGYMRGDSRIGWYFTIHSLFAAAMLTLVLADNLLFLYFAWELVGLGSYLLIGFWFEKRAAAEAAKKAFITTRIGDVGLLIGIMLLFKATGTFHITSIIHAAQSNGISDTVLISSSLLIFMGAAGKSAQFPLHVWLPDAMEGPTPVSALIHAATMVVAGVYLVARLLPLFDIAPGVLPIVSLVGLVTFIFGASIALVATDIKRILAYSTISHLGLMMLSLGALGLAAAMFHLVVHGFSKALLFLGAGSVMHGMHDETDFRNMGGLRKTMPITAATFTLGAFSLAGMFPLAGFFSKDEILLAISEELGVLFLILTFLGVFLSALYMTRLVTKVFSGDFKTDVAKKSHESSLVMTIPLIILSCLAVGSGIMALPIIGFDGFGTFVDSGHHFHMNLWLSFASLLIATSGIVVGWYRYGPSNWTIGKIDTLLSPFHKVVAAKYYIDDFYQFFIDKMILTFARWVALFDRIVVNDTGVDGIGISVWLSAIKVRFIHTGLFYNYGSAMAIGLFIVAIVWWVV